MVSAFSFFSCIITPQPKETSPYSGAPEYGIPKYAEPEFDATKFDAPEYVPPAVSPVASAPAISPSETIPWVSPPETIPQENLPETIPWVSPPETISQRNPSETIPLVSPPETIPQENLSEMITWVSPPETIPQENPSETITWVSPPETSPQEVSPEVVTLAAAMTGLPAVESESSAVSLPPVGQDRVQVPEYIMGSGIVAPEEMAAFLIENYPRVERGFIEELAYIYIEESAVEGVNSDVAFAQMCLETGFLRYGGLVTADMNNFCGLGAISSDQRGLSFPNPRMGVRAHIQHLKAYASEEPLKQTLVDPRFHYVRRGSSPAIVGLAGTWAEDRLYADKINSILERLYTFHYKL